jgi:hypothetical protein
MNTAASRAYNAVTREEVLADFYRLELLACGCPITANERMGDYAKRIDALNPVTPSRIIVDGRWADVISAWSDVDEFRKPISGYDYRFHGDAAVHWIKGNSPRLGVQSNG